MRFNRRKAPDQVRPVIVAASAVRIASPSANDHTTLVTRSVITSSSVSAVALGSLIFRLFPRNSQRARWVVNAHTSPPNWAIEARRYGLVLPMQKDRDSAAPLVVAHNVTYSPTPKYPAATSPPPTSCCTPSPPWCSALGTTPTAGVRPPRWAGTNRRAGGHRSRRTARRPGQAHNAPHRPHRRTRCHHIPR